MLCYSVASRQAGMTTGQSDEIAESVTRIPARPSFPAEFLGMAREWRRRFEPSDAVISATFNSIFAPLIERARRRPVPRPEMLAEAARGYRQRMPETGRLSLDIEHKRTRLSISDMRIGVSDLQHEQWQNSERASGRQRILNVRTFLSDGSPSA